MFSRPVLFAAVAALALLGGCRPRLDEKRTYTLEPREAKALDLPAISRPQRVTVDFASSAGDISVYLIKDVGKNDGLGEGPPPKEQTLDVKQGKSGSLSADISPDTATRVVVRDAAKTTEVTLSVTNRR